MGGEHIQTSNIDTDNRGSSPRGRGTHRHIPERFFPCRIIPAWAGNTKPHGSLDLIPDHPRVGGEHSSSGASFVTSTGSSPRGRGTHESAGCIPHKVRIIPAWAGNTSPQAGRKALLTDHPRVGGEHVSDVEVDFADTGSSPRGRGTRERFVYPSPKFRIIPAWAGNTAFCGRAAIEGADHPRVGGEHSRHCPFLSRPHGSSPRGRGTRDQSSDQQKGSRIIPAWAGNTR